MTGLPKGGLEAGETPEQTAAREVREETGVVAHGASSRSATSATSYRRGGRRVRKTVHFFLCEYVAGSTADHDHEVDDARWIAARARPARRSATRASGR